MANGILHNEGRLLYQKAMAGVSNPDRGTNVELRLFVNPATRDKNTGIGSFVQPTGGSYAPIVLSPVQAIVTGTMWSFPPQTFTAIGTPYNAPVRGWYLVSTGTTPRVIASEEFDSGPVTFNVGVSQQITPQIDLNLP